MGDFSGGPVVKTPCFHCQGQGFDPARETKIPCAMQRAKKKLCFFFKKRRGYEGRETSWKAIKIVPLSPRCLRKKPRLFLEAVMEERVTTVLNPRHLVHPIIHSCSLSLLNASYVPCLVQDAKDTKKKTFVVLILKRFCASVPPTHLSPKRSITQQGSLFLWPKFNREKWWGLN